MNRSKLFGVLLFGLLLLPVGNLEQALAIACVAATDNGPIAACNYTSQPPHFIIQNGLPPGDTIETEIVALDLVGTVNPGGSLGGQVEQVTANFDMTMAGTGGLVGYNRHLVMPIIFDAHTGPRILGSTPQVFPTDMFQLQGQLPIGDPDFDLLRITAGTNFAMPSPGHTTLNQLGPNNWAVDSFFDITYRIDFVGNPAGPFAGMSGSTTGTVRIVSDGSSDSDLDGIPNAVDPEPNNPCNPNPNSPACNPQVGGEMIPIESTLLLLAGAQTFSWMIPVILSGLGIGLFVVFRKSENS